MKLVALDFALHIFEIKNLRSREENNVVKIIGDDLDEMWMNNGDICALHQAGSKAHKQKESFKKENWTNKIQTTVEKKLSELQRFYSSSMKDPQRQVCYDLFLGVFKPFERSVLDKEIWDVDHDMYLHWEEKKMPTDLQAYIQSEIKLGLNQNFKFTLDKNI